VTTGYSTEIAIVGGGPAGAALAIRLSEAGHEVVLFERRIRPRWRACGVYSSPLTRGRLAALGLSEMELDRLIRPISAMVVETLDGRTLRLAYPSPRHACGFDRVRLDRALLGRARAAGARVHEGAVVRSVELPADGRESTKGTAAGRSTLAVSEADAAATWSARLLVGADGPQSLVARSAGVALPSRRFRRAGVTVHRADPAASPCQQPMEARMVVGPGWYCGVAPVPGARVNVGIVLGEQTLRRELAKPGGLGGFVGRVVSELPGPRREWQTAPATDEIQVALPLTHRTRRAWGTGFVLVGDAAGFIDPLSGEGLHRALVGADLAAEAIAAWSRGDRRALSDYDRHLRARFRNKDVVSWVLQAFLAQPSMLGHALDRLDSRERLGRTFGLALADLVPASRVLDPRFVARLLLP
jgi:menaquinone-9 beta-reductase